MANATPTVRFVRCPKCLELLAELPGITVYRCGGCGTTLVAKVHASSAEILGSASAAGSSKKNKSDGGSPDNKTETFEKPIPSSSDRHGENEMKALVSDSNGEGSKEKGKSPVHEKIRIEEITLEKEDKTESGITSEIKNSLNELNISSDQEIAPANKSLNSSAKLEESLEFDTSSKDDKMNESFRKETSLLLRRNSYVYEGSISSIDENPRKHIPPKHLGSSRRTFGKRTSSVIRAKVTCRNGVQGRELDFSSVSADFQSAQNLMESENDAPLISKSKDVKQFVKFTCSEKVEKVDKVRIMRKVDELKIELLEYFDRTSIPEDHFRPGLTARFERKFPTKHHRSSSLIPLPKQPKSSCLNPHHRANCCHNEHCRPCPHNVCCHLPESTTSPPLHMKHHPSPHREPRNLQSNDKIPQTVKRHCRPVSGGAPFVICYNCYKLLQLPVDFLVSTKKVHKLRCGSCHEVLRYVFRPRARSMPWTPAEAKHPPSENDNKEELDDDIRIPVRGDPVSFSEEYGISFGKSYSYDGIVEEEQNGRRKVDGSKLHKLMGYSSARYLLFENLSPVEGRRIGQDR